MITTATDTPTRDETHGEKHAVAIHEAGHAVCYCALGRRVERVYMRRGSRGQWEGRCLPAYDPHTADQSVELIALSAGPVAEARAFRSICHPSCWTGDADDAAEAVKALTGQRRRPYRSRVFRQALAQAERIVTAHWPAMVRVARMLLIHGELSGVDVDRVMRETRRGAATFEAA